MQRRILNYGVLFAVMILLVIGGYAYWLHQQRYPNTDDAYIQAHVVDIAPQVTGKVLQVFVKNQEHVKQNQLLFTIDPKPFEIALQKAQANVQNTRQNILAAENAVNAAAATVSQREAELFNIQKNYQRIMELVKKGFYARAGGDKLMRELTVAKQAVVVAKDQLAEAQAKRGKIGDQNAQIQAAKSILAQAELDLQYTKIYSPSSGQIARLTLRSGQTITAYQSLFSVIEEHQWWAMANMKETNIQRIRVGQTAKIYVDMYPSHVFHGVVTSISPGSGASFALLPAENATGNWVKVTQRFPVRVDIKEVNTQFPLRIGSSCTVTIDTQ